MLTIHFIRFILQGSSGQSSPTICGQNSGQHSKQTVSLITHGTTIQLAFDMIFLGSPIWGVIWDPKLGPRFGILIWTPIWDPIWDPKSRPRIETSIRDPD
jgi:hypothetical protein